MTLQFSDMTSSSNLFDVVVLNPEIENTPSEFCPISGDWGKLRIPNLARVFLIKCY